MKQLTCEMCGGTDLVKQDGVFVCQSCGCKYSMEEARKMLAEAPDVAVSNTPVSTVSPVKANNSSELDNLYMIARRAKEDNNGENAAKYYDMILVKDPTSWEASFYVVYFKAMECKIAQIQSAAHSVANCQDSVLGLIHDYVADKDAQQSAVAEIVARSTVIATMLLNGAKNHYDGISSSIKSNYTQEYVNNACAARDILYTCGNYIDKIFADNPDIAEYAATAWKEGIKLHQRIIPYLADTAGNKRAIASYSEKIGKYDPEYAKESVYKEKKAALELEISNLKTTISKTPTEPKMNCLGIFFLVTGIIMLILGFALVSLDSDQWWGLAVGIVEILLGVLLGRPNKATLEANKATVANAQKQLAEKEAELANLKK